MLFKWMLLFQQTLVMFLFRCSQEMTWRKSSALGEAQRKTEWKRRSRFSRHRWVWRSSGSLPGRTRFSGVGGLGAWEDARRGCWDLQRWASGTRWVAFTGTDGPQSFLTDFSSCYSLPQLVFRLLSEKALGKKTGVRSVCEGREWIKAQWERLELGWPLPMGCLVCHSLQIDSSKLANLWPCAVIGWNISGCGGEQLIRDVLMAASDLKTNESLNCYPNREKHPCSYAGVYCIKMYRSTSKHRVCIIRPLEITFIFFPLLNIAQLCCLAHE